MTIEHVSNCHDAMRKSVASLKVRNNCSSYIELNATNLQLCDNSAVYKVKKCPEWKLSEYEGDMRSHELHGVQRQNNY